MIKKQNKKNVLVENEKEKKARLSGKVVCITGSGRGIGKAMAVAFGHEQAAVIVTYCHRKTPALETAKQIKDAGGQALCLKLDVSKRASIRQVVKRVVDRFGQIDIWVNNAGILQQKPFEQVSDKDWDAMINTNLKSVFMACQEVMPVLKQHRQGTIINMASSGGQLGGPLAVHYSASKAGVICMTKSLARIGAADGITVNCISPGLIDTEMTQKEIRSAAGKKKIKDIPLMRPGTSAEVARTAVFLAGEDSRYITGQTININGGLYMG